VNLLIVTDRFSSGGLETHLNTLLRKLKEKHSYRIYVASNIEKTKQSEELSLIVDEIFNLPKSNNNFKTLISQHEFLKEIIDTYAIDIVSAHPFFSYFSSFMAAVECNIPISVTIHGKVSLHTPIKEISSFLHQVILPNSLVFTVNRSVFPKGIYLPNPIDEELWQKREDYEVSKDFILIVSRLDDDKVNSVIQAIEKLKITDFPIVVAGEGNQFSKIKQRFPKVIFTGNLNSLELKKLMLKAAVVVGMGRVTLEAAFLQKPVILLTYNGNLILLDDNSFVKASYCNFNGTNFISHDDYETIINLITSKQDLPVVSYHLLESFKSQEVADIYHNSLKNYIDSFTGFSNDGRLKVLWLKNLIKTKQEVIELKEKLLKFTKIEEENIQLKQTINSLKEEITNERSKFTKDIEVLRNELSNLKRERDYLNRYLNTILHSKSWKIVSKYYKLKILGRNLLGKIGILSREKKVNMSSRTLLKEKLRELKKKTNLIFIFPPTICWNIPLYQRPHQFAVEISKRGLGFIFCSQDKNFDGLQEPTFIRENLLLTDDWSTIASSLEEAVLILPSTNSSISIEDLKELKNKNWRIVYDYIDEIDDTIAANASFQKKRHEALSEELIDIACAVSKKLYDELIDKFKEKKRVLYVPNACDYKHFSIKKEEANLPDSIKHIVGEKKPIIGYYGALAKWIDYDLINLLAKERPEYNILLIGADYDGSMKKLNRSLKNLHIHPPVSYQILPEYAIWFDIAIIPFVKGDIAEATSPIKLFEYMALGKPPVCTDSLLECKLYKSPLIAKNHEEFIEKVDRALTLKDDKNYLSLLKREALQNTWANRVDRILESLNITANFRK